MITISDTAQIVAAATGLVISARSLYSGFRDLSAVVMTRKNGLNGFAGLVRIRRELFQVLCHVTLLASGAFTLTLKWQAADTLVPAHLMTILLTQNTAMTAI